MLTKVLKITKCDNIDLFNEYLYSYNKLYYKLYNNAELLYDKNFKLSMLNEHIDVSIYDMCVKDVITKHNMFETSRKNKTERVKDIEDILSKNKFKTNRELRKKYKLINTLAELKRNINKQITFGGKGLLRKITKLSQKKEKTLADLKRLEKYKEEFKTNRNIGIYLIGKACEKGNRKISFDLNNKKIIFKPNSKTKITFDFKLRGNDKLLYKLQSMSDGGLIPLTVRLTKEKIYLSYSEELVNGYSFDKKGYVKESNGIIDKEARKAVYKKYINELNGRKLVNKKENRFLSLDLNPNYIGLVIFDSKDNEVDNILHKELINLNGLNKKKGTASEDIKTKKQNNKRKHEICEVWKYIFGLVKHYKVYNFAMEDLNFKFKDKDDNCKEANRQTKNIWHLTLTKQLIKKYCNQMGLNLVEVNPVYTSFIGNMIYDYQDPIASSLEIGRRGIVKYVKGSSIYPKVSRINQEKLNYLLGENVDIDGLGWEQLYKRISLLRYRNPIHIGLKDISLKKYTSKVIRNIS